MKFIKKISKETSNAESSNVTRILRGSILSIVLTIAGLLIWKHIECFKNCKKGNF